jgi:hypothetical protein
MTTQKIAPLACNLTAFTATERAAHHAEAIGFRAQLTGFEQTGHGIQVYFAKGTSAQALKTWALRDQRCCPFLQQVAVRQEPDRVVLEMQTTREGAAFWINLFHGLTATPSESKATRASHWWQPAAIAAGLCLACLLPLAGGLLVARGLMPASWNFGEGVYLAIGVGLIGLYYIRRFWKKRRTLSGTKGRAQDAGGCGC